MSVIKDNILSVSIESWNTSNKESDINDNRGHAFPPETMHVYSIDSNQPKCFLMSKAVS